MKLDRSCQHCSRKLGKHNSPKHERVCEKNPENITFCPVCQKKKKKLNKTCGAACANKLFRSGENSGNRRKGKRNYRTTCFLHHPKQCIICGEDKIVTVHHFDGNHKNNLWKNLLPMCPTHHQYMHSRHKELIDAQVIQYQKSLV